MDFWVCMEFVIVKQRWDNSFFFLTVSCLCDDEVCEKVLVWHTREHYSLYYTLGILLPMGMDGPLHPSGNIKSYAGLSDMHNFQHFIEVLALSDK